MLFASVALSALVFAAPSPAATPATNLCTSQGGQVESYTLKNGGVNGKTINKPIDVCVIPWASKINSYHIPRDTLTNTDATLAVLAFNALIPPGKLGGAAPMGEYCANVGGTVSAAVKQGDLLWYGPDNSNADFCVFPDFSAIEQWTLLYHAGNATMGSQIQFAWTQ